MGPKAIEKPLVQKMRKKKQGTNNAFLSTITKDVPCDPSKLHILCLHGFRNSAKIMAKQMELGNWETLLEKLAQLKYLDAPWPASGKSNVEEKFPGPYFEWYQANEDFSEVYGLDDAISHISNYMHVHGPFDGIIGFSQGAVLFAALVGLHEKDMKQEIPSVNFLILIGGGRSKAKVLRPAYFDPIMCPSLHLIGDQDFMKPNGESLVKAFNNPLVIRHSFGHTIPKLGAAEEKMLTDFLLQQLELKITNAQEQA